MRMSAPRQMWGWRSVNTTTKCTHRMFCVEGYSSRPEPCLASLAARNLYNTGKLQGSSCSKSMAVCSACTVRAVAL